MAPKVSVIAILSKNASEAQKPSLQLRITLDGRKQTLLDTPMNIDFQGRLQTRIITKIQGMPIPAPGIMRINVTSKKGYLGTWNIRVNQIGQPTISTASPRARYDPASKAKKRSKKK